MGRSSIHRTGPRGPRSVRGATALLASLLSCSSAFALFSGVELDLRDFSIGREYFLDLAPYEYTLRMREIWGNAALEPGGPRGYVFSYGSATGDEALVRQDLRLRFDLDDPWAYSFRLFEDEAPDGRFRHVWTGLEAGFGDGWRWSAFGDPSGAKENTDIGMSLGHETASDAGGIRSRWEVRGIFVDLPFDKTNDRNALQENLPFDLQLSSLVGLGDRGWVRFEFDMGFPFSLRFGDDPLSPLDEQNFVFDYDKVSGSVVANLRSGGGRDVVWLEYRGEASDRGRTYFPPAFPAADFAVDYDLSLFRAEWWRDISDTAQVSLGYEFVAFDETVVFPNDAPRNELQDRTDHIFSAQFRRRYGEEFFLTTGVWLDVLRRDIMLPGTPLVTEDTVQSNIGFIFEFPTNRGEVKGGHFLLGVTIDLDRGFSAHGFGQIGVTF